MTARALFVAGAHTDVGKTFVAALLLRHLRAQGRRVAALKPVVSGFDPGDAAASDSAALLAATGAPLTSAALDAVSPFRFAAPLSPDMAARREGRALAFGDLLAACRARLNDDALTIVEGVGGVLSPIADDATNLDLIRALGAPVALVGGSYLGAISHTLTAAATLAAAGLGPAAVLVNQSDATAGSLEETCAAVARFGSFATPALSLARHAGAAEAARVAAALLRACGV